MPHRTRVVVLAVTLTVDRLAITAKEHSAASIRSLKLCNACTCFFRPARRIVLPVLMQAAAQSVETASTYMRMTAWPCAQLVIMESDLVPLVVLVRPGDFDL